MKNAMKNNMKNIILVLTGYRGCGKDTVANLLIQEGKNFNINFKKFAFADLLKDYCTLLYGFSKNEIEYWKRDNTTKFELFNQKLTMREILIKTANSLRAISDDGIWAKLLLKKIKKEKIKHGSNSDEIFIPIITDLRFITEMKLINKKLKKFNIEYLYIENLCDNCQKALMNSDEKEIEDIKDSIPEENRILVDCYKNPTDKTLFELYKKIMKRITHESK